MSTPASSIPLSGLARRLVQDGQLNEADANRALEQSRKKRVPLVAYLVDEKLVRQHQALPLYRRGNRLFVGLADPMNLTALDEIKFNTGIATEPVLVEQDKLVKLIEDALNDSGAMMEGLMDEDLDDLQIKGDDEDRGQDVSESDIDDTPVVRFVNKVLLDAINKKASDIHFEPYEKNFRVRFRLDGVLSEVAHPPSNLAPRITARIKVMSRMDISERRIPQDGRIKMQLSKNRAIDFRVNTCPTLYGEKVVLRILDPTSAFLGIDQLGYEPHQKDLYMNALSKPYGMILVTGPTGSGKTVSLYTGLGILNTADRNISTAEDPAEINMPGVNQVNVNPKVGLTFASALRAFLRQDPDIIMVGEIRDLETAEIAIKAAQTGHLVLSTLHTNDAPQTLTRLANMGVPSYNIASSILLIIAQRLGRRLCNHCKTPHDVPDEVLLEEGFTEQEVKEGIKLFKPVGCDRCTLGYKGRVGIYQVLPISEGMQRLILEGGNSMQLAEQAEQEGIADLRRSGLLKVKAGITSLEEINRITKD
ncbi:general secretion pathway protein GspE [Ectothiorhodospira haloalkaliphila]|uniref:General secretion pathway protein GspE n=1 Tax=Ectothiorhodospira haloalkaliphila TaxID=421628 RepID=W8KGH4_9GAMM|nr:type IV-A pilus assembly ATPase PilB [Ectothiorhodospira haloalkaliphila]AHK78273.1 general secretion pathway protein GspE [Ectothiorhodospira haloalkaliphila]